MKTKARAPFIYILITVIAFGIAFMLYENTNNLLTSVGLGFMMFLCLIFLHHLSPFLRIFIYYQELKEKSKREETEWLNEKYSKQENTEQQKLRTDTSEAIETVELVEVGSVLDTVTVRVNFYEAIKIGIGIAIGFFIFGALIFMLWGSVIFGLLVSSFTTNVEKNTPPIFRY